MSRMKPISTCLVLLFLLWLWGGALNAYADELATLNARGEAQLMVPPDQATLSVGVVTHAKTAQRALTDNNNAMGRVIAAVEALGFTKEDYRTRQLSGHPQWSKRPRDSDSDWRQAITSYRANNTIEITSRQLDAVGELIQAVSDAGANQIHSLRFGLKNPRQYRRQAIEQAVANARADADAASKASGQVVAGVKTISIDLVASIEQVESLGRARFQASDVTSTPPVNSGEVVVSASVNITFHIKED